MTKEINEENVPPSKPRETSGTSEASGELDPTATTETKCQACVAFLTFGELTHEESDGLCFACVENGVENPNPTVYVRKKEIDFLREQLASERERNKAESESWDSAQASQLKRIIGLETELAEKDARILDLQSRNASLESGLENIKAECKIISSNAHEGDKVICGLGHITKQIAILKPTPEKR
jgi:capsule polysaccharide export protein KpsE/RkpR